MPFFEQVAVKTPLVCTCARTSTVRETTEPWSSIGLREKLIQINPKVHGHSGYIVFPMAEIAMSE
jgi:hypothetical protein